MAIKSAFLKTISDEKSKEEVGALFDNYIKKCIDNHTAFYDIQTKIANHLHAVQKQKPGLTQSEIGFHTIQAYSQHKNKNKKDFPELSGKLDSHIQFMKEYFRHPLIQESKVVNTHNGLPRAKL